jgi:hypothetical protein
MGHATRSGKIRDGIFSRKTPKGTHRLGDLGINTIINLKHILQ